MTVYGLIYDPWCIAKCPIHNIRQHTRGARWLQILWHSFRWVQPAPIGGRIGTRDSRSQNLADVVNSLLDLLADREVLFRKQVTLQDVGKRRNLNGSIT